MKVLLVYPRYPDTFWSFRDALRMIAKQAAFPPLGLLTIAAMLPQEWDKKLVDMNAGTLTDRDIKWADYVCISAMVVQSASVRDVIRRCRRLGTKTVAGGPLFTSNYEKFQDVDHLVLNEAESTLPLFLEDLSKGCAKHIYITEERPDLSRTPVPMWSLVNTKKYATMSIQYSRGCPFDCEFCDIVVLNGNRPRTKTRGQLLSELEALYNRGWRETVFLVDDNFIGNKRKLKEEILPAMIKWQKDRNSPFRFMAEASINLADDEELMKLMVQADFETVFIGIETPNEESLVECNKQQNRNRDLIASVKKIQNHGMQVQGGFILGFDNDPDSIFKSQLDFIQKSGNALMEHEPQLNVAIEAWESNWSRFQHTRLKFIEAAKNLFKLANIGDKLAERLKMEVVREALKNKLFNEEPWSSRVDVIDGKNAHLTRYSRSSTRTGVYTGSKQEVEAAYNAYDKVLSQLSHEGRVKPVEDSYHSLMNQVREVEDYLDHLILMGKPQGQCTLCLNKSIHLP